MEPERSRPPLSVEEFVARILEKRDPVWEHYVEEPRDRLRQRQRRAGLRIGPAGAPSDADDSPSESQSSHALSATEAFVARITGRPTRLDTAAFVAAITGRDGPAGTPTSDAQYLDEAHFNPDEPRDERGRWTTSFDDDDPSGSAVPGGTPAGRTPAAHGAHNPHDVVVAGPPGKAGTTLSTADWFKKYVWEPLRRNGGTQYPEELLSKVFFSGCIGLATLTTAGQFKPQPSPNRDGP